MAEEMAAVQAGCNMGETFETINALLREIIDQARNPLSADLTADPLACAILRQWARQPWQEAHRAALVDRMLELGYGEPEVKWARDNPLIVGLWKGWSRTQRRKACSEWKRRLVRQFGDFEANTLPDGTEDTPP